MAITKKVGWNATTRTATVLLVATALPGGSVEAGQYTHEDPSDELSRNQYSHVTYQHVRDILFRFAAAKVQDMQSVKIVDATVVKATAITTAPVNLTISKGATASLVPTVTPSGADDKRVTYQSDDVMVAEVDTTGKVLGVGIGETFITVRPLDGTYIYKRVAVDVVAAYVALVSMVIAPATVTLSLAGTNTAQLTITPTPADASNTDIASWVSSDPTKATVSATGLVTGVAAGTTTITATSEDGAKTATRLITVGA